MTSADRENKLKNEYQSKVTHLWDWSKQVIAANTPHTQWRNKRTFIIQYMH